MNHIWKTATVSMLALALVATLCFGCASKSEEGVVITIGQISDLTGAGSPALIPLCYAVEDAASYYNEEGLVPGVKIKVITYDMKTDFARNLPGYDWVKERGAKVVITHFLETAETIKPFAEKDRVPLAALGTSMSLLDSPGWVFSFNCPPYYEIKTLLKWINEEHWDDDTRIPKIGLVDWRGSYAVELEGAAEEYCQAHPDQFQWVGAYLPPIGTMTWGGEVDKLKDCDYIVRGSGGPAIGSFIKAFEAKGYSATFLGGSAMASFQGFVVDMCGWEAVDGALTTSVCPWWNEPSPVVDLAKQLLDRYRSGQAEDIIHAGSGYLGGFHNAYAIFEILQRAIEDVGAENFDGQAFYDAASEFKVTWEGYPDWAFTETERCLVTHLVVTEWDADAEDMVTVSEWLPVVE